PEAAAELSALEHDERDDRRPRTGKSRRDPLGRVPFADEGEPEPEEEDPPGQRPRGASGHAGWIPVARYAQTSSLSPPLPESFAAVFASASARPRPGPGT